MTWEDFVDRTLNIETIGIMIVVFVLLLGAIMPTIHSLFGFLLVVGITLVLYPMVVYAENIASQEFDEVYYQQYNQQMQDEYDEHMRVERLKMQDGKCVNCSAYLDPNLPYCPNCNFKIEDYR